MFSSIQKAFEKWRRQKDADKLRVLTVGFTDSIEALAKKEGCSSALNSVEVLILGTFIVSEIYLGVSRDKAFATKVLDRFHLSGAAALFSSNLQSYQRKFPGEDVDTIYDQFSSWFYDTMKERYAEYRSLLLDERGLWRDAGFGGFVDLRKHLITVAAGSDREPQEFLTMPFVVVVVDFLGRCRKSLKQ